MLVKSNVKVTAWIGLGSDDYRRLSWVDETPGDYFNLASNTIYERSCYAMSDVDLLYPRQWVSESCTNQTMPYVCKQPKNGGGSTTTTQPFTTTTTPTTTSCGMQQYLGQSGSIRSPYFPYNFQGASCNYQINGSSNAVNIQIPAIRSNRFWVIDIYEGAVVDLNKKIYSISSQDASTLIAYSSPTPYMLITFYSADASSGSAFIMNYNSTYYPAFSTGYLGLTTLPPYTVRPTFSNSTNCEAGWIYDQLRHICYSYAQPASFGTAVNDCAKNGGQLLSIHSQQEEHNLLAILEGLYYPTTKYQVWLDGSFNNDAWFWIDKTPFVYSDWLNGNDPSGRYCMSAVALGPRRDQQGWTPQDCTLELPSLCYKQPS